MDDLKKNKNSQKTFKKWIIPVQKTIEKYEALREFIKTGKYNSILKEDCFICKLAKYENNKQTNHCNKCIHWLINKKGCGYRTNKRNESSYWINENFSLGLLINCPKKISIDYLIKDLIEEGIVTKNELLRKIGIRIGIHKRIFKKIGG